MLLIGILLLLALLITIPALVYVNQAGTKHGVTSQKRLKARAIAEEGTAYAIQQLAANSLNCGAIATTPIQSTDPGIAYTIQCTNGPAGYQKALTVVPGDLFLNPTTPPAIPGASIQTIVSRRTIGAKLPSGLTVSAAVQLGQVPSPTMPADLLFILFWFIRLRSTEAAGPR